MKIYRALAMPTLLLLLVAPAWGQGTLFVEGDNVGIGVASPSDILHVVRSSSGRALIRVIASGAVSDPGNTAGFRFVTDSGGHRWSVQMGGSANLIYNYNGGSVESTYHTNGDLTIAGTLNQNSSRAVKEDISPVNPEAILDKVVELPIATWSYQDDPGVPHLGPMAEDFFEVFGLGDSSSSIAALDSDGVALAAIQGLKAEKDAQIEALKEENAKLQEELEALRTAVEDLARRN